MGDRVKQTFSWVYKFSSEAAQEFRSKLKHFDDAFITYDSKDNLWTIDCSSEGAPIVLADFLPKFRAYHLAEYQPESDKLRFIGDVAIDDVLAMDKDSVSKEDEDDTTLPATSASNDFEIKRWTLGKGKDHLSLFTQDLLTSIGNITSTTVTYDKDDDTLIIKADDHDRILAAVDRLNNLQSCLEILKDPLSYNVVVVDGHENPNSTRMMVGPLESKSLGRKLLAVILVDPDDNLEFIGTLHTMYVAYAGTYDAVEQKLRLPQVIQSPHKATAITFGDFRPWLEFEYTPFGDTAELSIEESGTSVKMDGHLEVTRNSHPDMPLVERWRHGAALPVDAFASDELPITYEPPEITGPKSGVMAPPSLGETAMKGKYAVRKVEVTDDNDSDTNDEQRQPSKVVPQFKDDTATPRGGTRKERRQAVNQESWGRPPDTDAVIHLKQVRGPHGSGKKLKFYPGNKTQSLDGARDPSTNRATEMTSNNSTQEADKVASTFYSVLSGARRFTGQLSLEVNIGKLFIKPQSVSEDKLRVVLSVRQWREFLNPGHSETPPKTIFIDQVTSSGADCDFIVDLELNDKSRLFDANPGFFQVTYEFLCKTTSDELVVLTMYEEGGEESANGTAAPLRASYTLDRPSRLLGYVNYHFASHMWDARLALKVTPAYEATAVQKEAAQSFVDSVIVPNGSKVVNFFARIPTGELQIVEVLMRRWYRFGHSASDANSTPIESRKSGASPQLASSFYLQVNEVQVLHWSKKGDDLSQIHAYADSNEAMVKEGRLSYQVSIGSTLADGKFLENVDLPVGGVAEWTEGEIVDSGVTESLFGIAKDIVTRIDGVGHHNRGPRAGDSAVDTIDGSAIIGVTRPAQTVGGAYVRDGVTW